MLFKLKKQLSRVKMAGDLLQRAPMIKTKQAAQSLGDETLALLTQTVEIIETQQTEIEELKERL